MLFTVIKRETIQTTTNLTTNFQFTSELQCIAVIAITAKIFFVNQVSLTKLSVFQSFQSFSVINVYICMKTRNNDNTSKKQFHLGN